MIVYTGMAFLIDTSRINNAVEQNTRSEYDESEPNSQPQSKGARVDLSSCLGCSVFLERSTRPPPARLPEQGMR